MCIPIPERIRSDPRWQVVARKTILEAVVGSSTHGVSVSDQDDTDYMGVFIETPLYTLGLQELDTYTWRTQPEGSRSGPGDIDAVYYSLRKYIRLCEKGNPSVLAMLWLGETDPNLTVRKSAGDRLRILRDEFITQNTLDSFLGYATAQMKRLETHSGQGKNVKRPELVDAFGFDTKFAGHAIRLAIQGYTLFDEGYYPVPLPSEHAEEVIKVRTGVYPFKEALEKGKYWISKLEDLKHNRGSDFPKVPDRKRLNNWLVDMYLKNWFP